MKTNKLYSYLLVSIQFCSIFFIIVLNISLFKNGIVLFFLIVGLAIGLNAIKTNKDFNIIPEIKNQACLVTHGIYRYIRHPMYFSLIVAFFGFFIYADIITKLLYMILFLVLFLKAKKEEKLWHHYDKCYEEYKRKTKMFIPFIL
jgi:protein-S-isoprenylcysteine O-methyltransferase Ste14